MSKSSKLVGNTITPSSASLGPPAWLFSNNSTSTQSLATPDTMAKKDKKAEKAVKKQSDAIAKHSKSSTSTAPKPPPQLMDLVESFLSDQGFDAAHREFKKHRTTKAWKGHSAGKSSAKEHHSLVSIFQSWETFASKDSTPNAIAQVTTVSSNSDSSDSESENDSDSDSSDKSSDDDDVAMADAPASESSSSDSSSESESESDEEEEEATTSKPPTSKIIPAKSTPAIKSLKRKADSDSDSSSSDSDSDEHTSSSNSKSDKNKPQSKKLKTQDSSDESSSSESSSASTSSDDSSDEETDEEAKPKKTKEAQSTIDSSSESESDDSSSSSESDSDSEDEVEAAAKVPLPASDSESSSESESESEVKEEKSKTKVKGNTTDKAASDSSVTLEKASPEFAPLPPDPSKFKANNRGQNGTTPKRTQNQPFSRISKDVQVDPRLSSNAYVSHGYGEQAHRDLIVTKGRGFTKEKNKKKRGSYKGGPLDVQTSRSFKFDD
ncbi:hypothetical protein GGS24DRAFT_368026 [Hypoxylon argillaceum]|nr:hypothetical protein GGS24DRAFT_368026 [Hypoxylon argillaceum]